MVATAPHCETTNDTSQQRTTVSEAVCHTRATTQMRTEQQGSSTSRPAEQVCNPAEEPKVVEEQQCEEEHLTQVIIAAIVKN